VHQVRRAHRQLLTQLWTRTAGGVTRVRAPRHLGRPQLRIGRRMTENIHASPLVKVARDLSEIERLYEHLLVQAIHNANSRLMPGGEAMVALGNVGSPNLWAENIAAAEYRHLATCNKLDHTRCRFAEHVADEDDHEPP